ncbi:polysaccharide export protein [Halioxenophilus aromaticivorans]|uniref:Polysaccharide export protein n=2 Tax=Halioxenophilus aromaticivorans TaxID=1306992 RepID=A0AAV3U145_9ALTE
MKRGLFMYDDTPPEYVEASTEIDYIPINSTVVSNLKIRVAETPSPSRELEDLISSYNYTVAPGDVLTITVWEHPELTIPAGSFRGAEESGTEVKSDGTIFYPYAGSLQVGGLTTSEISAMVRDRLAAVIRNPQVDVRVAAFRSQKVFLSGAVAQPGTIPISTIPLTLIDAIEQLGGLSDDADWERVVFARDGVQQLISLRDIYEKGEMGTNLLLRDQDVIHIPRYDANKIFVLGEVNLPGSLFVSRNGTTLAEALSESRGINENRADGRGVYVLRNTSIDKDDAGYPVYKAQVFHLNAASAVGFMLADQFPLKPRDVVYVSAAPIARWNRFLSLLLPSLVATNVAGNIEDN